MTITVSPAGAADTAELAAVAALTFPLACPPSVAPADIASFLEATLSAPRFADYVADPGRVVLAAREDGRIVGYAMLVRGEGSEAELSKLYVLPDHHGGGAAGELMRSAIAWASERGATAVWLGVNQNNERAQRFYRKHGFEMSGTRTFRLGSATESDYLMRRAI